MKQRIFVLSCCMMLLAMTVTGQVAYYPFSGNAGDSSGFNNHGTVYPGATLTTDKKGQSNKAYSFNGTSTAYITVPASSSLNTASMNNVAISAWINPAAGSTADPTATSWILLDPVTNTNYSLIYSLPSNKITFQHYNGTNSTVLVNLVSRGVYVRNGWYHVVVRIDSTNRMEMFINGVSDTVTICAPVKPVSPILTIGKNPSATGTNNRAFLGKIDEVKVYNRYVSNAEILQLSDTKAQDTLVAYYPFTGNAGDSSGFDNHGTTYSGVTLTTDRNGQSNKAYSFNGTSSAYITMPAAASLNTANMPNMTVSAWIYPTTTSSSDPNTTPWILLDPATNTNYAVEYSLTTNKFTFQHFNGVNSTLLVSLSSKYAYARNNWYHVAIRIDSTNRMELFINGISDTATTYIPVKPVNPIFTIGKNPSATASTSNRAFFGNIDEVRVYSRYVSNTEIFQLSSQYYESLVAYYPFSGNAGDSSGFNNHGTVYAGATLTTDRSGQSNKAYFFNGTSSAYITVPASASLNTVNMNNLTVSAWIYPTPGSASDPTTTPWILLDPVTNTNYAVEYSLTTNKFTFQHFNGANSTLLASLTSKNTYPWNSNWYHVAVRIDSINRMELFINGVSDTATTCVPLKPVAPVFTIGKNPSAGTPTNRAFFGKIDEVRIYNRALTLQELQQLAGIILPVELLQFNAVRTGEHTALLSWITAQEINNDHFDIERMDEHGTWVKSGMLKGHRYSMQAKSYTFTDEHAGTGACCYRLKQCDADGSYQYSTVTCISHQRQVASSQLAIVPNPSAHMITVSGVAEEIVMTDITGAEVLRLQADTETDISQIRPGLYIVRSGTQSMKLVKY